MNSEQKIEAFGSHQASNLAPERSHYCDTTLEPKPPVKIPPGGLHPLVGIQPLRHRNAKVVLVNGGTDLMVGDKTQLYAYRLYQEDATIFARSLWQRKLPGTIRELKFLRSNTFVVAIEHCDGTSFYSISADSLREINSIAGQIAAMELVDNQIVVALRAGKISPAALVSIDIQTGYQLWSRPLTSHKVMLKADPKQQAIFVTDLNRQTVTRQTVSRCEPKRPTPSRRPDSSKPSGATNGCKCEEESEHPHTPDDSKQPCPTNPDDECRPGTGWVPGDCGGWLTYGSTITRHPCNDDKSPCEVRLDFPIASLARTGAYLSAVSANGRYMALIEPNRMQVLHTRAFSRDGALVTTASDANQIVAFDWRRRTWGVLDTAEVLETLPSLELGLGATPASSIIFNGKLTQGTGVSLALQQKRAIAIPLIEPGQAYTDADVSKLGDYLWDASFPEVRAYFTEASYGQLDMHIDLFGYDVGGTETPLQMPRSFRSYYHPPFEPGGFRSEISVGATHTVTLDGTESLTIDVHPRTGSNQSLAVPFCALSLSEPYNDFPMLIFNGTETATLTVSDTTSNNWVLNLQFSANTFSIDPNNPEAGLQALGVYLDGILQAAEANAGVPNGDRLFAPVEVRRVRQDDLEFGTLDINLRLEAGSGSNKGTVSVSSQTGLELIGLNDALSANFNLPSDSGRLQIYLNRMVIQAEADAGLFLSNRILGSVAVDFNAGTTLVVELELSQDRGGEGAFIEVEVATGLTALGLNQAVAVTGATTYESRNLIKEAQDFIDDAFSALLDRLGGGSEVDIFDNYDAVYFALVSAPPSSLPASEQWGAATADVSELRAWAKSGITARYHSDENVTLSGKRFIAVAPNNDGTPDNPVLAHELGHTLGFKDLYWASTHRDDLAYMEDWAMMDEHSGFPHFCGFHKLAAGWIDPAHIVTVGLPSPDGPTSTEALLVPIEYWDDGMEAAVRSEFGGSVPVAQLMKIDLGGDGAQFDLVEARQPGLQFSQSLPVAPGAGVLLSNCLDPEDDTRYAFEGSYRRSVHRLNTGNDLRNAMDTFNLAAAPELAAVGVTVTIVDVKTVNRPYGDVTVFQVRVDREQADFVDLSFTETTPNWQSPDVWIDHVGEGQSSDPADHRVYPEGTPLDQGETVRYPSSGTEHHWIVARVWNRGNREARNVKVNVFKYPPGAGDQGNKELYGSTVIGEVPGNESWVTVPVRWDVTPQENDHQCIKVEIADWDLPTGDDGLGNVIALASDDVWLSNNWAQQNVFEFKATSSSPYAPIAFQYHVSNDGIYSEEAHLEPDGLPLGMRLTVTPRRQTIAPGKSAIFNCVLELDETVIDTGCQNDREFLLLTWRDTPESSERWGGCKYKIRPRRRTTTTLEGYWWFDNQIELFGKVSPDPGSGRVQLRLAFIGETVRWESVELMPGGAFSLQLPADSSDFDAVLEVIAYYEGSAEFGSSYSNTLTLSPPPPVG
jgi:M6 family metalloprotease-like protein